jgi:uncharacterized protein YkwD
MRFAPCALRGQDVVRPRTTSRKRKSRKRFRPILQYLDTRFLLSASSPDTIQPTADEQYMLELINRARANPAAEGERLVSIAQNDPVIAAATRNENLSQFLQVIDGFGPEPPLAFNPGLIAAARDHDAAMLAANNQFHSPPGYLNNPQVATDANGQAYYPTGIYGWATGENVFAYSGNVPAGSSTEAYVNYFDEAFFLDWGNPDFGHLKNLLAPGPAESTGGLFPFSEIGIGLLTGVTPTVPPAANNPIASNAGLEVGPDLVTQEFGWRMGNAFLTGVVYTDSDHNSFYTPGEGVGAVTVEAVGQDGEGTFQTQTWESGGYSLALPPGTYNVTATGGNLRGPQSTTITIGKDNVAWDIQLAASAGGGNPTNATPAATQLAPGPFAQGVDTANTNINVSIPSVYPSKKHNHLIDARGLVALVRSVHHHFRNALNADHTTKKGSQ